MKRISLPDGRWFDAEKAQGWEESTTWDGRNHVSDATGSQFDHEHLYRTRGGVYVLHHWSQWQGSRETYEEISGEDAARWLVRNGYGTKAAREANVIDQFAALEIQ
jgi:hypothetical protein